MDRTRESSCGAESESASFDGDDVAATLHKPNGAPGYSDQEIFAQQGAYLARVTAPEVCKTLSAEGFDGMPDIQKGNGQPVVAVADMTHADEALREVKGGAAPTLQQRMGTGENQVPVPFAAGFSHVASGAMLDCQPGPVGVPLKRSPGGENAVALGFLRGNSGKSRSDGIEVETSPTLIKGGGESGNKPCAAVGFKAGQSANGGLGDEEEVCPTQSHQPSALEPTVAMRNIVRRLTPGECESLQGFPQGWTRIPWRGKPEEECPDSPRYRALGNSWATNCAEWVLRRIVAAMRLGIV